ncbi:hypothetical protein KVR01_008389 [Diaporthe batatas]|uniref:uncharacterized protein n=1 Tax=Diaporthe batatas TaxID=748121 RepID=UPI001D0397C7|nr:uncharacterized protein KVR01_008389 [Diaporthe batatas]KAG8161402.1 hypothetical protein KVR01_008389 [Diaporthe batatas]
MSDVNKLSAAEKSEELGLQSNPSSSTLTPSIDENVQKKLVRKIDLLVLPALACGLLTHAIDRSNIGNAKSDTLERDLHLVGNQFQLLLILFYIPLTLSSVPFSLLAKRFSPSRVLPIAMFGFGTVAMAGAATTNFGGMLACRMVLGVLEAAFLPLPSYYGSLFYTRRELSLRIACFFSAVNVAGAVSGLISFSVFQWRDKPLSGWRYLFLIEGAITVGMSAVLFVVLPRSVESSRFFSPEEKKLARARLGQGTLDAGREQEQLERFRWADARATLLQFESWAFMLMALSFGVALTGAANFLPSMIRRLTKDTARANLFTIGPHLTAMASQLGATFLNNRIQQRGVLICCFAAVAGVAWILLATLDLSSGGRRGVDVGYFLTYLIMAGTFTPPPLVAEWIASSSPTSTGRALRLGMFATAIPIGGIISSVAFRAQDAPVYQRGLLTCASFIVLLALLAGGMRVHFSRLNARMDRGEEVAVAPGFERSEWRHAL